MRFFALVASVAACAGFASTASAAPDLRDRVAASGARLASAEWGGTTVASNGEKVTIYFSDAYAVDPARATQWADFMTSLVHGPELSTVTVHLQTPGEVQAYCGHGALACYTPRRATITAPAEDVDATTTARGILVHEYGHHVAASRVNPPFATIDYGTKRWASYEEVCAGAQEGRLYPGGEDEDTYDLNPGEAFAESYRVLNEQRLGMPVEEWLVDESFFPDATALALLEQDVVNPWKRNTTRKLTAKLGAKARTRAFALEVPYDGSLAVTPRQSGRVRVSVSLAQPGAPTRTRRFGGAAGATLRTTVCGERSYTARVKLLGHVAKTAKTTVTLTVSMP